MTIAVFALAIFAACSRGIPDNLGAADHNEADVVFAQQMIVHHEQAIEMAEMASEQASSSAVEELAARIESAQEPEIETLRGWLEEWGEPAEAEHAAMGHGDVAGGMSEDQMSDLGSVKGAGFDRMFLELMIEHHEGAIAMATDQIRNGLASDAITLAETIKTTQEREVQEMQELLDEL
jgi:uncharacterized protein (DUF305 family)